MSVANGGPLATTSGGMKPVQIAQVKGNSRENRTAAHSHIKGLGLRSDGRADTNAQGFVGQVAAREVGCIWFLRDCHANMSPRLLL
jgi:RuvB-like protein 1 (pontin 52)